MMANRALKPVQWRHIGQRAASTSASGSKQKLVVLGSGWAGYNVARTVNKNDYDVTVVSPNSYFSFTPFLASAAVGTLEYRCATEPVRGIKNIQFAQGWADKIDFNKKTVTIEPALQPIQEHIKGPVDHRPSDVKDVQPDARFMYSLPYDKLVIAVGCYSASFGIPGVSKHAYFLKDIRDSRAIRNTILERLEQSSHPSVTPERRRNLLQFSIVGGGPTGVEFAAELHDFIQEDVYSKYPQLRGDVNIRVYDVAPGILMSFDRTLREYAERKFSREKVEVRPNSKITAVGADWIELESQDGVKTKEPFGLLVWSTGLAANPLMENLEGASRDEKTKSLRVNDHLAVLDTEDKPIDGVFAIGDNAMLESGRLPATAQVASQMAKYMTKSLNTMAKGQSLDSRSTFEWKNKGSMVSLGERAGLLDRSADNVQGPKNRLSGFVAWVIWRSYYMTLAMGWRNKILVPVYWTLAWFFGRDVTRF